MQLVLCIPLNSVVLFPCIQWFSIATSDEIEQTIDKEGDGVKVQLEPRLEELSNEGL